MAQLGDGSTDVQGNNGDFSSLSESGDAVATQPELDALGAGDVGAVPTGDVGSANGVASLDADGHVPESQLSSIAVTEVHVVSTFSDLLETGAGEGDIGIVTNESAENSYILTAEPASESSNWTEFEQPDPQVSSVFGRTGDVSAESGDYTASQVTGVSAGTYGDVDSAISSIDSDVSSHLSASNPHSGSASETWVSDNFNDYSDTDAQNAVDGALIDISGTASETQSDLVSHEESDNPHSGSASESWVNNNFNDYTDTDAQSALEGTDPSFGTVSASAVNISGDAVATESWVSSNYSNYTDSDARSAVSGSALSSGLSLGGTLDMDGNGLDKVDTIDFGSSSTPVSIGYDSAASALTVTGQIQMSGSLVATTDYVDNNFNDYSDSDAVSAVEGTSLSLQDTSLTQAEFISGTAPADDSVESGAAVVFADSGSLKVKFDDNTVATIATT